MTKIIGTAAVLALFSAGAAWAHGDVAPQPVDTAGLPEVGEEWLMENPYRGMDQDVWARAIEIGASGYNQNCARCHGLEGVSGGLAPDLRYLEAEEYGDEWYVERFQYGYTQNGVTRMPAFGELLGQEAAWAIRTYVETRPDDGAMDDHGAALAEIRDALAEISAALEADDAAAEAAEVRIAALREDLAGIAESIETASGAPVADSAAYRASVALGGDARGVHEALEVLTIGLSRAQ